MALGPWLQMPRGPRATMRVGICPVRVLEFGEELSKRPTPPGLVRSRKVYVATPLPGANCPLKTVLNKCSQRNELPLTTFAQR
jgi:hypothetical protein